MNEEFKQKIAKLRKKYGELEVDLDGETVVLKPPMAFYEKLLVATSLQDPKTLSEVLVDGIKEMLVKDLKISKDDAVTIMIAYGDKLIDKVMKAFLSE